MAQPPALRRAGAGKLARPWSPEQIAGWRRQTFPSEVCSYVVTLVERPSRFVILIRLPNNERATVVAALTRCVRRWPEGLMTSLPWDRGSELASHRAFTVATDVQVYFCDPHSPWPRGSNDNTNGRLRQSCRRAPISPPCRSASSTRSPCD